MPPYVVTADVIAQSEGVPADKIRKGLMVNEFRFPGYSDTIVTVGADAFLKFLQNVNSDRDLKKLYDKYGIDAVYGASESNEELSKPATMHILELVEPVIFKQNGSSGAPKDASGKLRYADSFEAKFACTGLAKMLHMANASIQNGTINSAVVMGIDFALYDDETAKHAQPTQGMAVTVIYLTKDPLLVSIDKKVANFNLPAFDFYKQGEHTPRVPYGYGSEVDYVLTVGSALESYEKKHGLPKNPYVIAHVPFSKEAYYLASHFYVHTLRKAGKLELLEKEVGMKEPIGDARSSLEFLRDAVREHNAVENQDKGIIEFLDSHKGVRALWDFHKEIRKTEGFNNFAKGIGLEMSLKLPSQIGNSYDSSMWVSEAGFLRELPDGEKGTILHASYGSGSGSSIFVGEIVEKSAARRRKLVDVSSLDKRIELTLEEYKALYRKRIEEVDSARKEDSVELDKEILRERFVASGFKLRKFSDDKIGDYEFNGKRIRQMPIVV